MTTTVPTVPDRFVLDLPEAIVTNPETLVDLLTRTAERHGLRVERSDETHKAAVRFAAGLQQTMLVPAGGVR